MMRYRPDIEGLRAVAVISVVLFHAGYAAFPAGFIGVDIFFVISGFLITSGIYKGIQAGNFSIIDFFNRRFWRIQPLLIMLMLLTAVVWYFKANPADLIQYAHSLRSLSLFNSNLYFAGLDFGYFADDTSIMPLLHTWSLSIEWQWYFALPFILVLFAHDFGKKTLPWLLFVGFFALSWYALHPTGTEEQYRYYGFGFRAFALLAGALIATIDIKKLASKLPPPLHESLSLLFLGSLIYIGTIEKTVSGYPNFFTLWVVLLTSFLIVLGSTERKTLAFKILSFKPFVFIGMTSYSLYIWHWPIFAYARYTQLQVTAGKFAVLILISVVVAAVSYKFIENPLRKLHKKVPLLVTLLLLVLVPMVAAKQMERKVEKNEGYPELSKDDALQVEWQLPHHNWQAKCHNLSKITDTTFAMCTIGAPNVKATVLVAGDSWGDHYKELLDVVLYDAGIAGVQLTAGRLLPFIDIYQNQAYQYFEEQELYRKRIFNEIASKKYGYVLIPNNLERYYMKNVTNIQNTNAHEKINSASFIGTNEELFYNSFNKTIDLIIENNAIPILITGLYDPPSNYSKCGTALTKSECIFEDNIADSPVQEFINDLQQQYPQIIIIDLHDLLCQEGKCSALIDNYPLYLDREGHISAYASHRLGEMYLEKYGNPFINAELELMR